MPTVLFIDDEADFLHLMDDSLGYKGYKVLTASDGRAGVEIAQQHEPDVIVCDLVMPDVNGFEVHRRLKASEQTADIPFIFLTGVDGHEMPDKTPYLAKPFKIAELIQCIQEMMTLKR